MTWAPPEPNVWGYTLAQLQAVRCDAIEECAKVCESDWSNEAERIYGQECADAIRKLLEQT